MKILYLGGITLDYITLHGKKYGYLCGFYMIHSLAAGRFLKG